MSHSLNEIKIVTGPCPFTTGELAFQDSAAIHQCVFLPSNLHTVTTREEAYQLVASIEHGCGSCSNVILHPIDSNEVEVIWSGCGNVKGPIIDKALQGLTVKDLNLVEDQKASVHILVVSDCSFADLNNRFTAVYTN